MRYRCIVASFLPFDLEKAAVLSALDESVWKNGFLLPRHANRPGLSAA